MPNAPETTITAKPESIAKFIREQKGKHTDKKWWSLTGEDDLKLVIHPTGAAAWYFVKRVPGRTSPLRLKLGDHGVMTLAEARLKTKEHQVTVGKGIDPKAAIKAGESFKAVAERALTDNSKWSKVTRKNYGYTLRNDVFPVIGHMPINTVTTDDCLKAVKRVRDRKKFRQADNVRRIMRDVFNWAKRERYVKDNPARELEVVAKPTARKRAPNAAELWTFWHALDEGNTSPQVRLAIRITILTALRRTEAAGMRCDERHGDKIIIAGDVEQVGVVVEEGRMKNGRQQTIFLSRQAAAILDEAMATCSDGTYFFSADTAHIKGAPKTPHVNPGSITTRMNRISHDKGVPLLGIHDMRRAATHWMEDEGVVPSVQEAILHHTPQTTRERHYLDQDGESRARQLILGARLRKTWQMWADHVERIVNAPDADAAQKIDDDARKAAADAILAA